jgi:hypothetical protein
MPGEAGGLPCSHCATPRTDADACLACGQVEPYQGEPRVEMFGIYEVEVLGDESTPWVLVRVGTAMR